jgi:hypothetical protein
VGILKIMCATLSLTNVAHFLKMTISKFNRPRRKVGIHFRMDNHIKTELCILAIRKRVSVSNLIRIAILEYIKRFN